MKFKSFLSCYDLKVRRDEKHGLDETAERFRMLLIPIMFRFGLSSRQWDVLICENSNVIRILAPNFLLHSIQNLYKRYFKPQKFHHPEFWGSFSDLKIHPPIP